MFRKINNKSLSLIFLGLLVVAAILFFANSGKEERSFRSKLVDIDSSAVTKIIVYSKATGYKPVSIFKKNSKWRVELPDGKSAPVVEEKIGFALQDLMKIKPQRLAARGTDKWKEFQVGKDSSGTRVQVYQGNDKTLDIILGRFNYQQQTRQMSTFVRLYDDTDIYEVDGFLAFTFNQPAVSFRDGRIVYGGNLKWSELKFEYPGDSSFTLIKKDNKWFVNNSETDSAKTATYLRTLGSLTKTKFADDAIINNPEQPTYKLTIMNNETSIPIEVKAFVDDNNYIIVSSQNPETKFDGKTFGKDIFVSRNSFFKK